MDNFTSEILENAWNAFNKAKLDVDKIIDMNQDVIGIVVHRGNNPRNGWWIVKPSHIEGHVKLDLDDRYEHLTIDETIKMIKKLNRK